MLESNEDKLDKYLGWLEELLSITEHFKDNMPVGERKRWLAISAAVANERDGTNV